MEITLNVGAVISKAPLGILGAFIEAKLRGYVEPERAGTPKGEPIGMSRKKYHAALLGLTSVDLRKQAKQIGVSYGVLRKWRTEEAFDLCIDQLTDEFIKGPFLDLADAALVLVVDPDAKAQAGTGLSADEAASISTQRLLGLDDASLYSSFLVDYIHERWLDAAVAAAKAGKDIYPVLAWVLPINRLCRRLEGPRTHGDRLQRSLARFLAQMQLTILRRPTTKYRLSVVHTITQLIRIVLED